MKKIQRGFGLLAAILVIATLTAGSYAAVKINEEMHAQNPSSAQVTATSTTSATSTSNIDSRTKIDISNDHDESSLFDASTSLQLHN